MLDSGGLPVGMVLGPNQHRALLHAVKKADRQRLGAAAQLRPDENKNKILTYS
jgi:hypothetical protein